VREGTRFVANAGLALSSGGIKLRIGCRTAVSLQ
jgi:hypothetical protein